MDRDLIHDANPQKEDRRVGFLIVMDSQIKICLPLMDEYSQRGWLCSVVVLPSRGKYLINREHSGELGLVTFDQMEMEAFFESGAYQGFQIIHVLLCGYENYVFVKYASLYQRSNQCRIRPILIGGVFGVEILKRRKGYVVRSAFDLVYVTAEIDLIINRKKYPVFGFDNFLATGLPFLDSMYNRRRSVECTGRNLRTIVYACQNAFPGKRFERNYLVKKLAEFARLNPDIRLFFKPRHRPNQTSLREVIFHEEDSIREVLGDKVPSNFILTYEPITKLLEDCNLLLTISSTASFEAIARGIPVGFLRDEVINDEEYGYWYFEPSGAICTFEDLQNRRIPELSPEWLRKYFKCDGRNTSDLVDASEEIWKTQNKGEGPLLFRKRELLLLDWVFAVRKSILIFLSGQHHLSESSRNYLKRRLHDAHLS